MHLLKVIFFCGLLSISSLSLKARESSIIATHEAENENRYIFIFFYKDQSEKTVRLEKIFDQAMQGLSAQAKSIKVNINEPSQQSVVEKFNLKRSPMPLVIVLAPNGAVTGGFYAFDEALLTDAITSVGAAKCLRALQDRKLVILCLQNAHTSNNESVLKEIKDFKEDARFANATEIVVIDPLNPEEQKFLGQFSIDAQSKEAITLLISPPAEVIGTYDGSVTKDQLITDLQKATSGCCGPGGCPGGKCGPK